MKKERRKWLTVLIILSMPASLAIMGAEMRSGTPIPSIFLTIPFSTCVRQEDRDKDEYKEWRWRWEIGERERNEVELSWWKREGNGDVDKVGGDKDKDKDEDKEKDEDKDEEGGDEDKYDDGDRIEELTTAWRRFLTDLVVMSTSRPPQVFNSTWKHGTQCSAVQCSAVQCSRNDNKWK